MFRSLQRVLYCFENHSRGLCKTFKSKSIIFFSRYKADVKYELDPEATQQHVIPTAHVYVPPKIKVNKVPVRQLAIPRGSVKAVNSYDFVADEGEQVCSCYYLHFNYNSIIPIKGVA